MLLLVGCVAHQPPGQLRPDDPTAMAVARWDCEAGEAASCRGLAATETGAAAARDLAAACRLGDAEACLLGAALPDTLDSRADIGTMASRACTGIATARGRARAHAEAACTRAELMGWRGEEVREVTVLREVYTPHALLPGGTAVSVNGGGVVAFTAAGKSELPLVPTEGRVDPGKVRALTLTPEGHLVALATDPFLAWDLHEGSAVRLDAWPRPPADHPIADIAEGGRAATARLGSGERVGVWALPGGALLGTVPRPEGKAGYGLRVNADGTRLAFVQQDGWSPADVAAGTVGAARQGSWEAWLAGIDLPAAAAPGGVLSPDGELLAVPEAEAVRLVRPDGQEVARIELPELGGNPLLHRLLWSADGGRLLIPLHGSVAIVTRPKATATRADDLALLQGIRPLPALPPEPASAQTAGSVTGTVSLTGVGVPGAEVRAERCWEPGEPLLARTDASGRYEIPNLALGCWTLSAAGPGGLPERAERLGVGPDTTQDLTLIPTTRVSGVALDSAGRPAAGVRVRARLLDRQLPRGVASREHVVTAEATTDKLGRFTLDPVPDGNFQVEAVRGGEAAVARWKPGGAAPELRLATAILVHANTDPHTNWAQVRAVKDGKEVKGTLEDDGTWITTAFAPGDVVDLSLWQAGEGGEGPTVRVTLPLKGEVELEGARFGRLRVVSGGRYAASLWLEGNRTCGATLDGCTTSWMPAGPIAVYAHGSDHRVGVGIAEVLPGEAETVFPAPLDSPTGTVTGRVVDSTGRPIPGVSVSIPCGRRGAREEARTGRDGRFRLEGVLPLAVLEPYGGFRGETRVLRVGGGGWVSTERPAEVAAGETLELGDIVLTAASR